MSHGVGWMPSLYIASHCVWGHTWVHAGYTGPFGAQGVGACRVCAGAQGLCSHSCFTQCFLFGNATHDASSVNLA